MQSPSLKILAVVVWGSGLVLGGMGCRSPEQGVLVEITQKAGSAPVEVDRLTIVVGVERAEIAMGAFVADGDTELRDVEVSGRDLTSDPYTVLVRDGLPEQGRIVVAVRAFRAEGQVAFAAVSPQMFVADKVLKIRIELDPEMSNSVTTSGCVRWTSASTLIRLGSPIDHDCDGDPTSGPGRMDCNDANPRIGPSRSEICGNTIDDNCNELVDEQVDNDEDQVTNCNGDCDDNDPAVAPGKVEVCDGKDNDCNASCDEGFDGDNDHFTVCGSQLEGSGCMLDAPIAEDCNDDEPTINPAGTEICDGKDNDCNGGCDDGFDGDADGFSDCGTNPGAPADGLCGTETAQIDCVVADPAFHPFQHEICNGKDDDCDDARLASSPCFGTAATAMRCAIGTRTCDDDDGDGAAGYGACVVAEDPATTYEAEFCTAYESAGCAVADPFRCAAATAAIRRLECTVRHTPNGALCPARSAPLPVIDAVGCSWAVLGGVNQENYVVGLAAVAAGPFIDPLAVCAGFFGVTSTPARPPQPDLIHLVYTPAVPAPLASRRDLVEIELVPAEVATCPAAGLECIIQ